MANRRMMPVLASLLILIIVICAVSGVGGRTVTLAIAAAEGDLDYTFYNDRSVSNDYPADDHCFDRFTPTDNTYLDGVKAFEAGECSTLLAYHYRYDKEANEFGGEFIRRLNPATKFCDPSLLAAICVACEQVTGHEILSEQAAGQDRIEKAERRFVHNRKYAAAAFENLCGQFKRLLDTYDMTLDGYKSSMFMTSRGVDGLYPKVFVAESVNSGGHAIVFVFPEGKLIVREECGYQPVDTIEPAKGTRTIDDGTPEPQVTPQVQVTPTPKPQNTPTPPPQEEKDLSQEYQSRNRNNSDTSGGSSQGGKNHDEAGVTDVKTPETTPETNSPDTYSAPNPPAEQSSSGGEEEASAGTGSGSVTADRDNGKTEGDATVTAGDGNDWGDQAQAIDDHPDTPDPRAGDADANVGDWTLAAN